VSSRSATARSRVHVVPDAATFELLPVYADALRFAAAGLA
jgi:hypothetical protein